MKKFFRDIIAYYKRFGLRAVIFRIVDKLTGNTLEITNHIKEIKDKITGIVSEISVQEHTFVYFIGVNSFSDSYVIGVDFTRGHFNVPGIYTYKNDKLSKV